MKYIRFYGVILLFLTSCTTAKDFVKPEVTLVDFRLGDVKILESSSVFTIRIDNENNYPVTVDGAVYNIYVEGKKIGKGMSSSKLVIPRLGSVTDNVTVHSGNITLAFKVKSILEKKEFDYKIKGKLFIEHNGKNRPHYFTREGHFDFKELIPEKKNKLQGGEKL